MTNLFAINTEIKSTPYVFCVADSQGSNQKASTKMNGAQKLVQRGDNLIMETGRGDIADKVYAGLKDERISPNELSEKILDLTSEVSRALEGDINSATSFFVVGPEGDSVRSYAIEIVDLEKIEIKRGITPYTPSVYFGGSGARQVKPALTRDMEQGYLGLLNNPLDTLALCFGIAEKAGNDLWVDDKLQIGFVQPKATRLLLHPDIKVNTIQDFQALFRGLTNNDVELSVTRLLGEENDSFEATKTTMRAFYSALDTQLREYRRARLHANTYHNRRLSRVKGSKKRYEAACRKVWASAENASPLVDAFMSGGMDSMVDAVGSFYEHQKSVFEKAKEGFKPQ